jgi:prepilin-type N-terminal cleavage/methylation domain-containing protein
VEGVLRRISRWLGAEHGFTLIELLISALVLVIGLLGLVGGFDSARKLTLLSERRTALAHRVQLEVERLQAEPYAELLMSTAPAHSSSQANPDYYINQTTAEYQYGASASEAEKLALATRGECKAAGEKECGLIASEAKGRECSTVVGACEWKSGPLSGQVYDFITWHTDGNCGSSCPAKENYKRITVVADVNVSGGSGQVPPLRVSTLIAGS